MVVSPSPVNANPLNSIAAAAVMNINNQTAAILSSSPIPPAQQQQQQLLQQQQQQNAHQQNSSTRFSENYEVKEELGKGAFSVVRRCIHKSNNMEFVSCL
jgi:hypothetical protein